MSKVLIAAALFASASAANASNVITNGNFETGTLAGWSNGGAGCCGNAFYAVSNNGSNLPSGQSTPANPNGGSYFAVGDQSGPGTEILIQSFTVSGGSQTLSFDWYNHNTAGGFSGSGALSVSDQTMRVDIMTSGAAANDTGAGVVQNLMLNQTSDGWTNSLFNLNLAAGNYQLRFATSECCSFQEFGVDNVSLDVADVPEPAMIGLFGMGAIGLGLGRRRKAA